MTSTSKKTYDGVWKDMATIYRKMGLSEEEIAERILCKTTKIPGIEKDLNGCDKK